MNILVDINHPAHVHLFKHAIRLWQQRGHQTYVVARDKDVTLDLLDQYKISYKLGGVHRPGVINQSKELLSHTMRLVFFSRQFKPDVLVSLGSPMAAWASFLLNVPHIAFDDTEHARLEHLLYRPFTRIIYTPSSYSGNFGPKQRRYNGSHELAYLHPNRFTPNPTVLNEIGLKETDAFFIIRFVSWGAAHDAGHRGFSVSGKRRLVTELEKQGRVIITSEERLPNEFEPYRMSVAASKIHDLLAYSSLYIGEGATMALEAALLGVPSIYVNPLTAGILEELERHGLLHQLPDENKAIERSLELANNPNLRVGYKLKRQNFLKDKIDVTAWMVNMVEEHVLNNKSGEKHACHN